MPRRYRSKDYIWWYFTLGDADTTVDQRQGVQPPRLITGVRGGHDVDLRRLAADGVVLIGRVLDGPGGRLSERGKSEVERRDVRVTRIARYLAGTGAYRRR